MVREFEPGKFECERYLCPKKFEAGDATERKSVNSARKEARLHESNDAQHVRLLDLSTLNQIPKISSRYPSDQLNGHAIVLLTKKGMGLLSTKTYPTVESAQNDATMFTHVVAEGDLTRQEKLQAKRQARSKPSPP